MEGKYKSKEDWRKWRKKDKSNEVWRDWREIINLRNNGETGEN